MKLKRKIKKYLTTFNVVVFFFTIMTGYLISKSPQNININNKENVGSSVLRVAEAFEIYNEKRFK